jgi:hypothetical protein
MKLVLALAPFALLGLVSASPPPGPDPEPMAQAEYPPCSARVTDRCIQREGRRSAARHAQMAPEPEMEPDADSEAVQYSGGDYPPCTAQRQDRCRQSVGRRAAPTRYAMAERERIRIGERG